MYCYSVLCSCNSIIVVFVSRKYLATFIVNIYRSIILNFLLRFLYPDDLYTLYSHNFALAALLLVLLYLQIIQVLLSSPTDFFFVFICKTIKYLHVTQSLLVFINFNYMYTYCRRLLVCLECDVT